MTNCDVCGAAWSAGEFCGVCGATAAARVAVAGSSSSPFEPGPPVDRASTVEETVAREDLPPLLPAASPPADAMPTMPVPIVEQPVTSFQAPIVEQPAATSAQSRFAPPDHGTGTPEPIASFESPGGGRAMVLVVASVVVLVVLAVVGVVVATRSGGDGDVADAGGGPPADAPPGAEYLADDPEVAGFVEALASFEPDVAPECDKLAQPFSEELASIGVFLGSVGAIDDPELQSLVSNTQMAVADTLAACGRSDRPAFDQGVGYVIAGRGLIIERLAVLEGS